jgi:signal transduction histidine kinase
VLKTVRSPAYRRGDRKRNNHFDLIITSYLLDTDLTPIQRDWVQTMQDCGDNLLVVINDILDFSKIESGNLVIEAQIFYLRDWVLILNPLR